MRRLVAVALGALLALPAGADPARDYMLQCRGCHGPDAAGVPGAAPALRAELAEFLAVPGGREYLLRVPGVTRSELDDAALAALLNWLLASYGEPGFTPYSAAEVGVQRGRPLLDPGAARRALLARMPPAPHSAAE